MHLLETFLTIDLCVGGFKRVDKSGVQLLLAFIAGKALFVENTSFGGNLLWFKDFPSTRTTTITNAWQCLDEGGIRDGKSTV